MNKAQFLEELTKALTRAPRAEVAKSISYYSEILDDRMEEGLSEEEAVASLGSVEEIAEQILADLPAKPKYRKSPMTIILLVLGFPVWFPLLAAAASVILALGIVVAAIILTLYLIVWVLDLVFWCVEASFACSCVGLCVLLAVSIWEGKFVADIFALGTSLSMVGTALLMAALTIGGFFLMVPATKWLAEASAWAFRSIVNLVTRKRRGKA